MTLHPNRKAFTLLEVVVAGAILAFGAVAVVRLFSYSLRMQATAKNLLVMAWTLEAGLTQMQFLGDFNVTDRPGNIADDTKGINAVGGIVTGTNPHLVKLTLIHTNPVNSISIGQPPPKKIVVYPFTIEAGSSSPNNALPTLKWETHLREINP